MNKSEIETVKSFVGSIRGAELVSYETGDTPKLRLTVVTGVSAEKGAEITTVIMEAPYENGENTFTSDQSLGVERLAIDPECFSTLNGAPILAKRADAMPKYWNDAKKAWGEFVETATMVSVKVAFSHRVDVKSLAGAVRVARKRSLEGVWQDIPAVEGQASFPYGEGRITVPATKHLVKLLAGEKINLLPLPVELLPARKVGKMVMEL